MIVVVAIALTTCLFTSLFTIAMSINSNYEMYIFRQIGGYCHGTFKEVTEEQIPGIANHSNVKAIGKRISVGYIGGGAFAKVPAEISFMDDNCAEWSFAKPSSGQSPKIGKEISMDINALKLLGIEPKLGAEIELTYTVGTSNGMSYEKTDTFTLVGWWEYDKISPVHYINISEEYAKEIENESIAKGMNPFRIDLNVMMTSNINIRGLMEQVNQDLGYSWDESGTGELVRIGVNWGYTTSSIGEKIDITMVVAIIAILVLIIFTGYLIIYNIFQISVTGDIRFYGLLKTIGVTPRQLRHIIRLQAMFLCVIGIPVGLLLGYVVGAVLTPAVMEHTNIGAEVSTISTSPFIFLVSAMFAIITVVLSCSRPGRMASRVSPVEATKYTEVIKNKKKRRSTRGAKVYQMAFANLERNSSKTILVVISLALSVVLLNILVMFTTGFNMEKYLAKQIAADFIVSSTDYFRFSFEADSYFEQDIIEEISANTIQSESGYAYKLVGTDAIGWMPEEVWRMDVSSYGSEDVVESALSWKPRQGKLVGESALIEGLDETLFKKLRVVEGDIKPLLQGSENYIALIVNTDDYGNVLNQNYYPEIGTTQTITYVEEAYFIDSRTGELADDQTPNEYLQYYIAKSHDVTYIISAYVDVPYSMSYRYNSLGYGFVLPVEKLEKDSGQEVIPMVYLFDTPDASAEEAAERYLAKVTSDDVLGLMYESKATLRDDFVAFQNMFLLLGGVLCTIIGIVGVLNFVNAIMTSILSRKREFAVLQAVGMTSTQLKEMLVYEGLFYAFSSSMVALLFSFIVNPLIGILLENMFWFFSANFTIFPVISAIPFFALLGWLIPTLMYRQVSKHSIVEQLRDDL